MKHRVITLAIIFFACLQLSRGQVVPKWNRPEKPFQIADNVYYVGTNALASYLITTPEGDILINPDYAESVPLIEKSVAALGRKFSDIKIILISHAHDDHAAGCALAKKISGARLMVMAQDVPEVENGGAHDFAYHVRWAPAHVDRILHDEDRVTLGGITLVARLTPGHTKGCTTWTADVKDRGRLLHMVIVGSPNVNPGCRLIDNRQYPEITQDYERTFRVLQSLPCDLFLGAHGAYFNLDAKLKQLRPGGPDPFIDPVGYRAFIEQAEQKFKNELARQQEAAHMNDWLIVPGVRAGPITSTTTHSDLVRMFGRTNVQEGKSAWAMPWALERLSLLTTPTPDSQWNGQIRKQRRPSISG